MSHELILADRLGKKFHRAWPDAFLHGAEDRLRKLLRREPAQRLRKNEFWALEDISFIVERGECLGIIGPNGAGKTTLLKLIHREYKPDAGRVLTLGGIKSLLRLGAGLQPMLSGRENIYIEHQRLGLGKRNTDAALDAIVAFAGLERAIDAQVKTYSDGMYARLDFAIATSVRSDILLVDEVLAVGDIAFQIRALERLALLKREGAAIVFVSHSEMNVRQIADRCLLLFDGRQIALGEPDTLFYTYYESVGYLDRRLAPLGAVMAKPQARGDAVKLERLRLGDGGGEGRVGKELRLELDYVADRETEPLSLCIQFWTPAGALAASVDSDLAERRFALEPGRGKIAIRVPFLSLTAGVYRLAAGFGIDGRFEAYRDNLLELRVVQRGLDAYPGLAVLDAAFETLG
jgi:ABC-type polysaccharide/polyol phosphate transport system ATPase subunit